MVKIMKHIFATIDSIYNKFFISNDNSSLISILFYDEDNLSFAFLLYYISFFILFNHKEYFIREKIHEK